MLAKPQRLLLVEVKGRRGGSRDRAGMAALHAGKRRRLARSWACWQAAHPQWAGWPVEWVAALVPLPGPAGQAPVRWIRLEWSGEGGADAG